MELEFHFIKTNIGGISGVASFATLHHLHKSWCVCTIPVPSSIVTKSPEITLKAFSGF
jgi:hypothetical protein